jgi:hypothetical protein
MDAIWGLHEPAAASQALDCNDNEPPFIDRSQTFSAKHHPLLAGEQFPLHI